jgi:hypothetical protein
MLTYNKDTDQLELYDGSAFGPVGSDAGLIHIKSTTITASSSESINDVFSSEYDNYKLIFTGSATTLATFQIRWRVGGADASGNDYSSQIMVINDTSIIGTRSTSQNLAAAGTLDGTLNRLIIEIGNPFATGQTVTSCWNTDGAGTTRLVGFFSYHNLSTSFTGLTLIPGAGSITGQAVIYGYRKS